MAKVFVKFYAALGGRIVKEDTELNAGNIRQILEKLAEKHGKHFREEIFDDGEVKNYYILLHNGQAVSRKAPEKALLSEGDTVHIFPPISGG